MTQDASAPGPPPAPSESGLEQQLWHVQRLEAIGRLAGGVAHEFNNALGGIVGYANIIRGKLGPDHELSEYAAKIEHWAMHASELSGELLAFARRAPMDRHPMDIHECLSRAASVVRRLGGASMEVVLQLDATRSVVDGDKGRLEDAVLKLVGNARDAMPDGGRVTIRSEDAELSAETRLGAAFGTNPGAYIKVMISDTGTGMGHDVLSHLFEPFYTTGDMATSTGLSLASVYGTVKQHNGYILADSTPGEGSAFTLYLPLASDSDGAAAVPEGVVQGTGTVLVVVPDQVQRESATVMLGECGYDTLSTARGDGALGLCRSKGTTVDVVLMDLVLPGENSARCLRQLREVTPEMPVVVASPHRDLRMQYEIETAGASALVDKPFRIEQLSRAIADACASKT